MPDLYFYRDPKETETEESGDVAVVRDEYSVPVEQNVDFTAAPQVENWADETAANWKPAETQDWAPAGAVQKWWLRC